jgi:hypothetical protein
VVQSELAMSHILGRKALGYGSQAVARPPPGHNSQPSAGGGLPLPAFKSHQQLSSAAVEAMNQEADEKLLDNPLQFVELVQNLQKQNLISEVISKLAFSVLIVLYWMCWDAAMFIEMHWLTCSMVCLQICPLSSGYFTSTALKYWFPLQSTVLKY